MVGTMKITKHGKKVFKENGVYESYVWCIKELDELSKKKN